MGVNSEWQMNREQSMRGQGSCQGVCAIGGAGRGMPLPEDNRNDNRIRVMDGVGSHAGKGVQATMVSAVNLFPRRLLFFFWGVRLPGTHDATVMEAVRVAILV